ncbi:MAG: oligoendopeptidase F [Acidobacteria bacterium RIFCSPLOWO2_02_FULL_67_36]|nr:MAG: oligoendopeptidase F [Acidobacteria bacterium RIFCSPLOWO2_02_FULL_67_36]OFW24521.1 MAG: oligoendopeptidase F [Acidobacteria bacterium RIFCSPLOWO2_12_FULL_66_21]
MRPFDLPSPSETVSSEPARPRSRRRDEIPDRFKWNLRDIFTSWDEWEAAYKEIESGIDRYAALKGTLASGPHKLLDAFRLSEGLDQLAYRVWYFPSLQYDEDQRDNTVNAKRQQVQLLFARLHQAGSWFNPELLKVPLETVRRWMDEFEPLRLYRFAIESLYRQQEHVLDEAGERLMSLASRVAAAPNEAYWALSTADAKFPTITLSDGSSITVSYGQYRAILATRREQADREAAFRALHETYQASLNTYATLYNGVCQRDWFQARARGYTSTLDAALHGDNIPTSVVENLIETTRAGADPLRRYHRLRRKALGVPSYHVYDFSIPLVTFDKKYEYDEVLDWIVRAVAPLGDQYQRRMREGFSGGWIDVYENEGKRSGAYSAPVYGTHPYMLLNYTDTLDDMFTLAHEMGHSMHTILSHETQPFVYSGYTIFVAEVPSTLSEALLLEYMLARSTDPAERIVLLQHAIDNITGTFFTQVMFADYELRAHRLAEQDQPITAEILTEMYRSLMKDYYGDAVDLNSQTGMTWARIPHFFNSPYYVFQYATCFASAARLAREIMQGTPAERADARERYLTLLRSGGNDYPMEQLKKAGVDLSQPDTVLAVVNQLDNLVTRLERELAQLATRSS